MRPPSRTRLSGAWAGAASALTMLLSIQAHAQSSYVIEEITDFQSGMPQCKQSNLNTVTASLGSAVSADGWSGFRYVNENVWEQDFWDPIRVEGGLDPAFADSARVTVYAGHGAPGTLFFPGHGGAGCTASTARQMMLGPLPTGSGGAATLAIWLACEVLNVDLLAGDSAINIVRQQLGWTNIISIADDEPRDFYNATRSQPNKDAWLRLMAGPGGQNPITGEAEDRRPIVVTMAEADSEAGCWEHHDRQAWAQNVVDPLTADGAYVCWEYVN